MKKIIIFIMLFVMLMGCSREIETNDNEHEENTIVKIETDIDEAIEELSKNVDEAEDLKIENDKNQADKKEDMSEFVEEEIIEAVEELTDVYRAFINELETDNDIIYDEVGDLNGDGDLERIIGVGYLGDYESGNYFDKIYILNNIDDEIVILETIEHRGYGIYRVELIEMEDDRLQYIYCGLTNGVNLFGFELFSLTEEGINSICYSASATGAGDDFIQDTDDNGLFDGYRQSRWSYDYLYYNVNMAYIWEDGEFIHSNTWVDLPEYAESALEVVFEYIRLKSLNFTESVEVSERLSDICIDEDIYELSYEANPTVYNTFWGFDDLIEFSVEESNESAIITATYTDEMDKAMDYIFTMVLIDNKWHVEDIESIVQ